MDPLIPRPQDGVIKKLIQWAEGRDAIRALLLTSTRAVPRVRRKAAVPKRCGGVILKTTARRPRRKQTQCFAVLLPELLHFRCTFERIIPVAYVT